MTHIWVDDLTIIVSYHGLSPGRRQAFMWNNAVMLLSGSLELQWNFNQNSYISIQENAFENVAGKMAAI